MKYRKKPIVIDAFKYELKNMHPDKSAMPIWVLHALQNGDITATANNRMSIETEEGVMTVSEGDWIIRGVAGELYPCKPDIFAATYDEVVGD